MTKHWKMYVTVFLKHSTVISNLIFSNLLYRNYIAIFYLIFEETCWFLDCLAVRYLFTFLG